MGADYLSVSIYMNNEGIYAKKERVGNLALLTAFTEMKLAEKNDHGVAKLWQNDDGETVSYSFENWLDETGIDLDFDEAEADNVVLAQFLADRIETLDPLEGRDVSDSPTANSKWSEISTGGMSWGDSPTDAFDVICFLLGLPDKVQEYLGVTAFLPPAGPMKVMVNLTAEQLADLPQVVTVTVDDRIIEVTVAA